MVIVQPAKAEIPPKAKANRNAYLTLKKRAQILEIKLNTDLKKMKKSAGTAIIIAANHDPSIFRKSAFPMAPNRASFTTPDASITMVQGVP